MVVKGTKISPKMKNKSWLSKEKKYYKMRKKLLIIIIRNYFHLEMLVFSWGWAR